MFIKCFYLRMEAPAGPNVLAPRQTITQWYRPTDWSDKNKVNAKLKNKTTLW